MVKTLPFRAEKDKRAYRRYSIGNFVLKRKYQRIIVH